jgi:DNA modification methylase
MPNVTETASTVHRDALYRRYRQLITTNPGLSRSLVSFQANKGEPLYRWYKYKEGFSSSLVGYIIGHLPKRQGTLLDPFAGVGTSLFASRDLGWNAIGLEVLPVGVYAIRARLAAEGVKPRSIRDHARAIRASGFPGSRNGDHRFAHIPITEGAFSTETENQLAAYLGYCSKRCRDTNVRQLLEFACFAVLEDVSYTRKDGQYLRWDYRSGRTRGNKTFDKGTLPSFIEAVTDRLDVIADDLEGMDCSLFPRHRGSLDIRRGSCLDIMPELPGGSVDLVLTSPPYCNRYDYTRTYALELAFLGCDAAEVKALRQAMLSCTVENREKADSLRRLYKDKSDTQVYKRIQAAFAQQPALREVLDALEEHRRAGRLNNPNITRMVWNYFLEMAFIIYETARVLAPGGHVAMVNDNVRYAGEEVPVDLILSDFAASFGLVVRHIWKLPTGKGNSSQQMGAHGRSELRKGVFIWQKPE